MLREAIPALLCAAQRRRGDLVTLAQLRRLVEASGVSVHRCDVDLALLELHVDGLVDLQIAQQATTVGKPEAGIWTENGLYYYVSPGDGL